MKKTTFLLISLLLIFVASNAQKNATPSDSMILVEYYKLKGPNLNKVWEMEDYTKAGEVIQKLKEKGIEHLPRKKGAFSGQILDKITNPKNYDSFLQSNEDNMEVKLETVLEVSKITSALFSLYFSAYHKKGLFIFSNEITQSMAASVAIIDAEIEIVETLIQKNPNMNATQEEGLKSITSGLDYFVGGGLKMLMTEYQYYEREDIVLFANAFFPFYYKLKSPIFSNEAKEESDRKINHLIQTHPYKEVRRAARNKSTLHEDN